MTTFFVVCGTLCFLGAFLALGSGGSPGSLLITAFLCWVGAGVISELERIYAVLTKK